MTDLLMAFYVKMYVWFMPLAPVLPAEDGVTKRCEWANLLKGPVDMFLGNFRGIVETYSLPIAIAMVGLIAIAAMSRKVATWIKIAIIGVAALVLYMALVKNPGLMGATPC